MTLGLEVGAFLMSGLRVRGSLVVLACFPVQMEVDTCLIMFGPPQIFSSNQNVFRANSFDAQPD